MIIVQPDGLVVDTDVTPTKGLDAQPTYTVTITSTDGTTWDLNAGPVTLQPGVKLFDIPAVTHWLKSSPGIAGARWTGVQIEEQSFTLPVCTRGVDWQSWRDVDKAFFAGLAPTGQVTVAVTSPDAQTKSIGCHLVTVGDGNDDLDPLLAAYRDYQLGLVAPNPFWQGDVVTETVTFADTLPLFLGPPFKINSSQQTVNTTIANPGDVPAWPRFTIGGAATSWTVGVGDSVVSSSVPPVVGGHFYIDSAPGVRTIVDDAGGRRYADMDQIAFAPIPPGTEVPIVATMSGYGADSFILVELTPQYWRPL